LKKDLVLFRVHRKRIIGLLIVVLPLMIAATGMLWGNSRILDGISHSVDELDELRTWQAVQSAFKNELKRISSILSDNARWDDAVDHSYNQLDKVWLQNTWGMSTIDGNYDTALVINDTGQILFGFQNGQPVSGNAHQLYGSSIKKLVLDLARDTSTFNVSHTLVKTQSGIAALAAAPILPHSPNKKFVAPKTHILVFSKAITDSTLRQMSEQYVVKNMKLQNDGLNHSSRFTLTDTWGSTVSAVSWSPAKLGGLARGTYLWSSISAVAALLAAMAPVSLGLGYTLSKLDQKERAANKAARHDILSGLPNRLHLNEFLEKQLAVQPAAHFSVMLIDLDGFKMVNDVFDHATGDKLIVAVAAGLQCLVNKNCIVARLGGDEFAIAIIAPDPIQEARVTAENILKFLSEPFDLDGRTAFVGASIGIALATPDITEAQELMRRADIAMYNVKASGGNNLRFFETTLDSRDSENLLIADELRSLLNRKEFDINYQPLVDAKTHKTIGVEALARWPKQSQHQWRPDRFIAVAEQFGLIDKLCMLLLKKAFQDCKAWPELRLSVNISPVQLNNRDIVAEIIAVATEANFDLGRLEVEFTEAILIKNSKQAQDVIRQFKQQGVHVGLDDFGTGYASVGYLRDFNFDTIKLDRSLTRQTASSADALQVVQGTILIAKGLSATVVAEGIETQEEANIMYLAGCQLMQGYFFCKPLPADEITNLLQTTPGLNGDQLASA
jgi:diguanylate cyclase (GGDEF)-like protein